MFHDPCINKFGSGVWQIVLLLCFHKRNVRKWAWLLGFLDDLHETETFKNWTALIASFLSDIDIFISVNFPISVKLSIWSLSDIILCTLLLKRL